MAFPKTWPVINHNFTVFIGALEIPFSKVSSIEIGVETETLLEGGENRYVHTLAKPFSGEKRLILERGVASGVKMDFLYAGCAFMFIIITVRNPNGDPAKVYVATEAILKKRTLTELNAMTGQVYIESLEFIYRDITELPGMQQ